MFDLVCGGIGVMPDFEDNSDHKATYHETGTRIIHELLNVGDFGGSARVGLRSDNILVTE